MELINKYIARGTKKSEEATKAVPLSTVEKTQENKIRKKTTRKQIKIIGCGAQCSIRNDVRRNERRS